jgi:hypothetical protein
LLLRFASPEKPGIQCFTLNHGKKVFRTNGKFLLIFLGENGHFGRFWMAGVGM